MSTKAYNSFNTRVTSQSEPIPGSDQVKNSAGGFGWEVSKWTQLDRFLILGTEGGTYYVGEKELTNKNAKSVLACLKEDGPRTVAKIVEISEAGRAPKNDPAIFALALAFAHGSDETKRAAELALPKVCRIGTHLFHFAQFVEQFRGWGRSLKRSVGNWYVKNDGLEYDAVKYRQRDGWSHRDLLRLSHPTAKNPTQCNLFDWIAGRGQEGRGSAEGLKLVEGFEQLQVSTTAKQAAKLVSEYNLPREAVPTQFLKDPVIWEALLPSMGYTALLRNLGNMTKIGFLKPGAASTRLVLETLANVDKLRKSRAHPVQILSALLTYQSGRSVRGDGAWDTIPMIVDGLDKAFYNSFGNVEASGKRQCLALDVSGSMGGPAIAGVPGLSPRVGSAAMALVTANVESDYHVIGFSGGTIPLDITPRRRLDDVCKYISRLPFDRTDCAQPMLYAMKKDMLFDSFVIYTDSETWAGAIHPTQALQKYREKTGIPARLTVVGMTSNGFTIADPKDSLMLDVVGFDTNTPRLISDFTAGRL